MILLLGGTSDTGPLAERLAGIGCDVLVSTASDVDLDVGRHSRIERRIGPLDADELAALIERRSIQAIVDAAHPYATGIRANARQAAKQTGRPYITYVRPPAIGAEDDVIRAADHADAPERAFAFGRGVLLTTGAGNLSPYASEARRTGLPLFARVLDRPESLDACQAAGIDIAHVIAGRGPFSVEDNRRHIRQCDAGVLVTKDGGDAAAVRAKLCAVSAEDCRIIVIARPIVANCDAYADVDALLQRLKQVIDVADGPR